MVMRVMSDRSTESRPITIHPLAELLPEMSDEEREALQADIKENGLLDKIIINSKRQIIDGRHRTCLSFPSCPGPARNPTRPALAVRMRSKVPKIRVPKPRTKTS